jgi:DNA polymerase-3 subunit delta'
MFESVLGQEHLTKNLMGAFERGHLPHAMIFVGPDGVGKDAAALELARLILCPNGKGDDDCSSCRRAAKICHPDLHFVVPLPRSAKASTDEPLGVRLSKSAEEDLAEQLKLKAENPYHELQLSGARFILIDQIRAVKRLVSLKSFEHGAKVYILSQAHSMTDDAQVSLLKILEEPPENTYIILTTSSDNALLSTIRSRSQRVAFPVLPANIIENALVERENVDRDRAVMISNMSDGNYRRALTLLTDDSILQRDDVLNFLRTCYTGKPLEIQNIVMKLTQRRSVADMEEALRSMLSFLHDAWTLKYNDSPEKLAFADVRDTLVKFGKTLTREDVPECIDLVEEAISDIRGNVIPSLVLLTLAQGIHRVFQHQSDSHIRT